MKQTHVDLHLLDDANSYLMPLPSFAVDDMTMVVDFGTIDESHFEEMVHAWEEFREATEYGRMHVATLDLGLLDPHDSIVYMVKLNEFMVTLTVDWKDVCDTLGMFAVESDQVTIRYYNHNENAQWFTAEEVPWSEVYIIPK